MHNQRTVSSPVLWTPTHPFTLFLATYDFVMISSLLFCSPFWKNRSSLSVHCSGLPLLSLAELPSLVLANVTCMYFSFSSATRSSLPFIKLLYVLSISPTLLAASIPTHGNLRPMKLQMFPSSHVISFPLIFCAKNFSAKDFKEFPESTSTEINIRLSHQPMDPGLLVKHDTEVHLNCFSVIGSFFTARASVYFQHVDLSVAPTGINFMREKDMDFSVPYYYEAYSVMFSSSQSKTHDLTLYTKPFSLEVW